MNLLLELAQTSSSTTLPPEGASVGTIVQWVIGSIGGLGVVIAGLKAIVSFVLKQISDAREETLAVRAAAATKEAADDLARDQLRLVYEKKLEEVHGACEKSIVDISKDAEQRISTERTRADNMTTKLIETLRGFNDAIRQEPKKGA